MRCNMHLKSTPNLYLAEAVHNHTEKRYWIIVYYEFTQSFGIYAA